MKQAAECARRVRKLMALLKKEGSAAPLPPVEDPMEQLIRGVFTDFVSESRANAAAVRLRQALVDVNELRVTPISELVQIVGADTPFARRASEELSRSLNAIYNKLHHLDLAFIMKGSKRTAESFLRSVFGLNTHARATIILRCLKGSIVPVDVHMSDFLRGNGYVPPDASVELIQKFLAGIVPQSQLGSFYVQFKRYAAAHPPKSVPPPPVEPPPPPEPSPVEKSAARSAPAARKSASRKAAPPTPAPHKAARRPPPPRKRAKAPVRRSKKSPLRPRRSKPARRRDRTRPNRRRSAARRTRSRRKSRR